MIKCWRWKEQVEDQSTVQELGMRTTGKRRNLSKESCGSEREDLMCRCLFHVHLEHTVSWLDSSVTFLVSKAPLNRTVKNGCFWVDWTFRIAAQNSGGH